MHGFSCLLQNNLLGVEMLFEIGESRLLYFKQPFHTEEVILQQTRKRVLYFYSTTTKNIPLLQNEVGRSVTSLLYKTVEKAVLCCTLVMLGM